MLCPRSFDLLGLGIDAGRQLARAIAFRLEGEPLLRPIAGDFQEAEQVAESTLSLKAKGEEEAALAIVQNDWEGRSWSRSARRSPR